MDDSKLEYRCPWCWEWLLKTNFLVHQSGQHRNTPGIEIEPKSLEDIERRFLYLGMWSER